MSADEISWCPICVGEALGKDWRTLDVMDLQTCDVIPNQFREEHECYIDKGMVYFIFYGDCRDCGYTVKKLTMCERLPDPAVTP